MEVQKCILTLFHLLVIWSAVGTIDGQNMRAASNNSENRKITGSKVKIHTCCGLNLNLPENCSKSSLKDATNSWIFPSNVMAENISTQFQLETQKISCKQKKLVQASLSIIPRGEGLQKLLKNGYLKVQTEYYPPAEYCINGINETDLEFSICKLDPKQNFIRKCCSLDKVYNFGQDKSVKKGCQVPKGEYFKPTFYKDFSTKYTKHVPDPHYVEHYPSYFKYFCPTNRTAFYLFPEATEILNKKMKLPEGSKFNSLVYRIREDGKILFRNIKDGKCSILDPDIRHVCIDGVMNYGRENHTDYENNEEHLVMFLCSLPSTTNTEIKKIIGLIYGSVMIFGSVFLFITVLTYIALWERQSVHGWTIVSHTVCLFFLYIFLGIAHIIGVTAKFDFTGSPGCIGIGIILHYFFLATFCWLFLISVDLWLTFRALTPRAGRRSKGVKRYIKYSIFGWGLPLVFVIVGIVLDAQYPATDCQTLITPAYGKESCYLQQEALGVYIYYPVALMIALNLILFALTTFKLYVYRKSTNITTTDGQDQQFCRLFLKLFCVMGITWVFEVISWAVSTTVYDWYWLVFDMLNIFRAVAVFIIYVCKRDIIFALEDKYPFLKRMFARACWRMWLAQFKNDAVLLPFSWIFKRSSDDSRPSESLGHNSSIITRTTRQTVSNDGRAESTELMENSKKLNVQE